MNMHKPLEALLRPPVEWYSTGIAFIGAFLVWVFPNIFMVQPSSGSILATIFISIGLLRFKQGYRVWRYQKNLKRMPLYKMSSQQLPVSQKKLFLGKGFLWTAQH